MKNKDLSHQETPLLCTPKQIVLDSLSLSSDAVEAANGLYTLFKKELPKDIFPLGTKQRVRNLTPATTAYTWIGQVLHSESCRGAIFDLACHDNKAKKLSTSAYTQARDRLHLEHLKDANKHLCETNEKDIPAAQLWHGHRLKGTDATSYSMPDTAENSKVYAYPSGQKEACGFPLGQLLGLFDLITGLLVFYILTSWQVHEASLVQQLLPHIKKNDVLVGDRAYCIWALLALLQMQGSHGVMRLHQSRKLKAGRHVINRPQRPRKHWGKDVWESLPATLEIRIVMHTHTSPGFLPKSIYIMTTLLDEKTYSDADILALYGLRWDVEISFRHLKETLGMGILRTKTPERISKEIAINVLAYNLLRQALWRASGHHHKVARKLSFSGALSVFSRFGHKLHRAKNSLRIEHYPSMMRLIAKQKLPERKNPHRWEPRVVKRRPKNFSLMTKPRKSYRPAT